MDVTERARAALEGVTDGPWVVNRDGWACISSGSDSVFHGYFEGSCGDCGDQINDAASVAIAIEDAEFIAAARTLVPDLLAELEATRALLSATQEQCREFIADFCALRDALPRQQVEQILAHRIAAEVSDA